MTDQPEDGRRSNAPAKPNAKPNKRNKTGKKNPAVSKAMKEFWQDPKRTAEWRVKHDKQMAARRASPEKAWSRRGIPNGMTAKKPRNDACRCLRARSNYRGHGALRGIR